MTRLHFLAVGVVKGQRLARAAGQQSKQPQQIQQMDEASTPPSVAPSASYSPPLKKTKISVIY